MEPVQLGYIYMVVSGYVTFCPISLGPHLRSPGYYGLQRQDRSPFLHVFQRRLLWRTSGNDVEAIAQMRLMKERR